MISHFLVWLDALLQGVQVLFRKWHVAPRYGVEHFGKFDTVHRRFVSDWDELPDGVPTHAQLIKSYYFQNRYEWTTKDWEWRRWTLDDRASRMLAVMEYKRSSEYRKAPHTEFRLITVREGVRRSTRQQQLNEKARNERLEYKEAYIQHLEKQLEQAKIGQG